MKRINYLLLVVVIFAGILSQSCEKIENPVVSNKYVTLYQGFHGNNEYKLPVEGAYYTSEEEIQVYFIQNRDTIFKPQFSVGGKSGNRIGDTIFIFSKSPEQLVKVLGRMEVIQYLE